MGQVEPIYIIVYNFWTHILSSREYFKVRYILLFWQYALIIIILFNEKEMLFLGAAIIWQQS